MNVSAISNSYPFVTKSTQYDTTYPPVSITPDESYMEEEESNNTSSMLPLIVAGAIALGGLGFGIYKHREVGDLTKKLSDKTKDLETANKTIKEKIKKITTTENALNTANAELEKLKKSTKPPTKETPKEDKNLSFFQRIKNWFNGPDKK